MGKELVTKSNSLINASYYLNLGEYRLITSSVALARKAGLGITADRPLKISVQEFASLQLGQNNGLQNVALGL